MHPRLRAHAPYEGRYRTQRAAPRADNVRESTGREEPPEAFRTERESRRGRDEKERGPMSNNTIDATSGWNRLRADYNIGGGLRSDEGVLKRGPNGEHIFDVGAGNDDVGVAAREGYENEYAVVVNGETWYLTRAQLENATFRLGEGDDQMWVDESVDVPIHIEGGDGSDIIFNAADQAQIDTGDGSDWVVNSGNGVDIDTGNGNDAVWSEGHLNTIRTGAGNDEVVSSGYGSDIDTGDGSDGVWAQGRGNVVNTGRGRDGVVVQGDHNVVDTGLGNDSIHAWGDHNVLGGHFGNDQIVSVGSDNTLVGDRGHDSIYSEGSRNRIDGGSGRDAIWSRGHLNHITGFTGRDFISSIGHYNRIDGQGGWDRLQVQGYGNQVADPEYGFQWHDFGLFDSHFRNSFSSQWSAGAQQYFGQSYQTFI